MALRLAVIGDPVSHSLSPAIHTAALAARGLDGTYRAIRVAPEDMDDTVAALRRGDLDGVNVTMPLKGLAAALVDDITPEARRAGSVNTIVRHPSGRLSGHSTDISALRRLWPQVPGRPTLVLGTGGAAAAACIAHSAGTIYVSARRAGAVANLADRLQMDLVSLPWGTSVVEAVVVNATPVGMAGEELPGRVVALASALIDLAYGPAPTPAVKAGREAGIAVVDGVEFLVNQAADSFRLWTGREAPMPAMVQAAQKRSSPPPQGPNHE